MRTHAARALTLVEAVFSIVIVGGLLVAAANAVGASAATRQKALQRTQGQQLARALMAEIVPLAYQDPDLPTVLPGCELGESAADRTTFDDVDDFSAYSQSPPRAIDGTALTADSDWSWRVAVEWVSRDAVDGAVSLLESNVKRITVTVKRGQVPVATLVGLRANVE